ncbi:MAG: Jag N-terminal domain-containing protein [Actinomycetia bacterium]|nr:Jag N-terminal domain-containing protein [Actinomycetes bacterium]
MEWVEVTGSTVDVAVEAAMAELGLESVDQAEVEVIDEGKAGFLGVGSRPAIVKVSRKPRKRNRRSRRGAKGSSNTGQQKKTPEKKTPEKKTNGRGSGSKNGKGSRPSNKKKPVENRKNGSSKERRTMDDKATTEPKRDKPETSIEDQAKVAEDFLSGLLKSFGLEGDIQTRIEDDVLYLDVVGEQTEALVGPKGATMYSVLELTRTTVQRHTFGAPRMRIDIAGYGARRREALTIYTGKLVEQVKESGGEAMLEPMNAADRKVIHDAAAAFEGVKTYSEGEDPRRAVVISSTGDVKSD